MVYELRDPQDYRFGQLQVAAAISDTTLSSPQFATLPTNFAAGRYMPIELHDPAAGVREVVWVTGHTASSQNVTVVRGREGTTAVAWPSGTQWVCAPTAARDALGVVLRANLPTDAHFGARFMVSDEQVAVQKTGLAGWQPDVGVGNPADVGRKWDATDMPLGAVVIARGEKVSGTTDGSSIVTVNFKQPFPNACTVATATIVSVSGIYVIAVSSVTASQLKAFLYKPADGSLPGAGISVTFTYIALGY